jgi:hypothetical protein
VWVVYFSLAALPLFGIGGWFVPSADGSRRALVFGLLVIYVASGMGLLLATSFLGLRRYLRQRKLEMPMEMTTTWILVGVVMIISMLLVAAILPRPSREYSLSQLPFTVTSAVRRASRFAVGKDGTKDDEAQNPATTKAQEGQKTERQADSGTDGNSPGKQDGGKGDGKGKKGQGKASGQSAGSKSGEGGKGEKGDKPQSEQAKGGDAKQRNAESQGKSQDKDSPKSDANSQNSEPNDSKNEEPRQSSQQQPNEQKDREGNSQPQQPSGSKVSQILSQAPSMLTQTLGTMLKWLFYGGILAGGLIAAWVYREELMSAWQKLLAELSELWDWWLGKKKAGPESAAALVEVAPPPRTFASFTDPFLSGDAHGMSWPQLVRYTFEALEAWGREQACARSSGQTPHEFALALAGTQPQVASGAQMLAVWYGQLAYAPKAAAPSSIEPLRQLWATLAERRQAAASLGLPER